MLISFTNSLNQFIMGKVVGLIGSASGKIGNVVYSVSNGIQTARAYQPNVANPKSTAQNLQRAKANLIGRLSAITPREAIIGLGPNNRLRRAAFLRNGLLNATATLTDGVFEAKLQPNALRFSEGAEIPVINPSVISISPSDVLTISYTRIAQVTQDEWAAAGGYWIVVAIDSVTGNYDFVRIFTWSKPAFPSSSSDIQTQTVNLEQVSAHEVFVYFVPFVINPEKAATVTGGVGVDAAAYVANLGLKDAASSLSFGYSRYIGEASNE